MIDVTAPMEQWAELTEMYSAPQLVGSKPEKGPASVKSQVFRGHRYTAIGIMYGPYGGRTNPVINAYRLALPSQFDGEMRREYHDEQAIVDGRRARGDHTGLLVKAAGTTMVCATPVNILQGLPGTPVVDISLAKVSEKQRRGTGWRARHAGGVVTWHSLAGHPVVRYEGPDIAPHQCLIWSPDGNAMHDMHLASSFPLEPLADIREASSKPHPPAANDESQLALFG
ncbi:hypothetical protein [Halomonas sp. I5-271120]|uniref:hypothetical protein n=1 Tax=Halomonas sp. I5-271120 TaxID=3061632 RepID=UPI00271457B0|nr:hypothetical protein [Halomonas sp. I5-271120]